MDKRTHILISFMTGLNQSAITSEAREEYIKQYSKPSGLRAGF